MDHFFAICSVDSAGGAYRISETSSDLHALFTKFREALLAWLGQGHKGKCPMGMFRFHLRAGSEGLQLEAVRIFVPASLL